MTLILLFCFSILFSASQQGGPAPAFQLSGLNGKKESLEDIIWQEEAQPAVLVFFDTLCEPCKKELPQIRELYGELKAKAQFRMVAVGENRKTVSEYAAAQKPEVPILLDEATLAAAAYGVVEGNLKKVPQTVIIGKDGGILKVLKGYHADWKEQVRAVLLEEMKRKIDVTKLSLLYTGSANGYMESCDCPEHPFGGLDRRLKYLEEKKSARSLSFDTGDSFSSYKDEMKNAFVARFLEKTNYD
ncbi:MAG TPA: TlpA disulfide reductase family protein, partial [bacterium]|nr:TlpA disulfide reductase family protein [bacterium]